MCPSRSPSVSTAREAAAEASGVAPAEPVPVEESRIEIQASAGPSATPAPASPAAPAWVIATHIDARAESEPERKARRIPQIVVTTPGRSPHVCRAVDRNVHHLRIGRQDLNGILVHGHHLLAGGVQPAVRPGLRAHSLHRAHYVGLLGQERIPKVGSPADVVGQQIERIRKRYQRLDARVPVLQPGSVHQLSSLEVAVPPEPLVRFHDFQRIRTRRQYLAEQRVGVQRDRRHQVIQLVRREKRSRLLRLRRR